MTQKALIEKLNYPNVIEETFYDLAPIKDSVLKLIGDMLDETDKQNLDVSQLMQTIMRGTLENTFGMVTYEIILHMLASAFLNGFAQGALAAQKVLEIEDLERMVKL